VSDPLVTVITPVHNGERFLGEALESLIAQDYAPLESVVVDDGSTDGTAAVARRFPVTYLHQAKRGPAAARNAGLAIARGSLVAFLDADDVLPRTKLSTQARYLAAHPEVDCVLGRQEFRCEPGFEIPPWLARDLVYEELGGIPLVSAMFRRPVLDALGGFDPAYRVSDDLDLFVRMRERGHRYEVLADLVLYRRIHGGNLYLRPDPPGVELMRSLKAKLDRGRRAAAGGPGAAAG
jgi:glycosyltransferase involved in cell wall biosynthesis